jgi:hypothetical protein
MLEGDDDVRPDAAHRAVKAQQETQEGHRLGGAFDGAIFDISLAIEGSGATKEEDLMDLEAARREIGGDEPGYLLGAGVFGLRLNQHDAWGHSVGHAVAGKESSPSRTRASAPILSSLSLSLQTKRSTAPNERPASARTRPSAKGANSASSWNRPLTKMMIIEEAARARAGARNV